MEHKIKILEMYANEHLTGKKPWELRKNDRNYKVKDYIKFIIVDKNNEPTGKTYIRQIRHLFLGGVYGLQDGFCIMTLN